MTIRQAHCACGALRLRAEGDPVRISICHCLDCKRRSGSAFAWTASYDSARVAIEGESRTWERISEEGYWARFRFWGACGGAVYYEIERRPGMISIPAGVFADADFPSPEIEVYEERACPWLPELGLPRQT